MEQRGLPPACADRESREFVCSSQGQSSWRLPSSPASLDRGGQEGCFNFAYWQLREAQTRPNLNPKQELFWEPSLLSCGVSCHFCQAPSLKKVATPAVSSRESIWAVSTGTHLWLLITKSWEPASSSCCLSSFPPPQQRQQTLGRNRSLMNYTKNSLVVPSPRQFRWAQQKRCKTLRKKFLNSALKTV